MMRIMTAALSAALVGLFLLQGATAQAQIDAVGDANGAGVAAQSYRHGHRAVVAAPDQAAADAPARLSDATRGTPDDVYPRYFPGRNAVRDCTATYVQEFRPSGTVIVPRMNCYWRRG